MATSFFNRWSKKKLEGESASQDEPCVNIEHDVVETESETAGEPETVLEPSSQEVGDAEQSETNIASLLTSQAESAVKKAALRKLFLSGQFSEVDGLNDYDHDYKAVKSLSSDVAEKLRDWMQSDEEEVDNNTQLMSSDDDLAKHEEVEEQTKSDSSQSIESTETVGQNIPHKE
ncbi:DUF3306 domain-containing protein [Vibrio europaeus]|uniref:DUF3306 domain-containing protein n=1 Tax=Vibrio europaeus TaxID=300876 RepID=A0AAE7DX74_9VIBR|nr:DUF3306 domain-containing protein [Vibrio europaeus]MDC5806723.1 DUF3306 domain-containing protein [Vibrio europaeus]MDC5827248.1 DUF3306 domain-containing protein [Vibrio europaeus]MDC5830092.1 DUF3306 domain-containing protein [Vibrio europaeus]MDC5836948.1 DUF3306 domain-containing protein [Vibrio europaeus]QJY36220.1 DUF3306 domain-containing protein [Vibrio europaeus]